MSQSNTTGTRGAPVFDDSTTQEGMKAKREMAKRLMEGDGVEKNEAKAVSLLRDCVAHGDADAMLMVAKYCALACGIRHNVKLAETLVSKAAEKGNDEARFLLQLINDWKGKQYIDLEGLGVCFPNEFKINTHVCMFLQGMSRENARLSVLHL